jgi:hypothetical protein
MKKILWIMVALTAGVYINMPLLDPDLWWHVTVGRWIISHGWVPYVDYWNAFSAGKPWVAYSWTQEILFALADSWFGLKGLLALQMLLFISVSLALAASFSYLAKDWFFGLLLGCLTVCSLASFVLLRPQTFVWIYFLVLVCLLTAVVRNNGKVTIKLGIALVVTMSLWANAHITTVMGVCLCVAWLWQRVAVKTVALVTLLGFVGTLITPYGGLEWMIFFTKSDHPFAHGSIIEFGPATIRDYGTGIYIVLVSLLVVLASKKPHLVKAGPLVAVIVIGVGGLGVVKFLPFATILLAALIADYWADSPELYGEIYQAYDKLRKLTQKIEGKGLLFLLVVLFLVYADGPFHKVVQKGYVPDSALDFIKNKKLPFPLLNAFGEGGYIMYRLSKADGSLEHRVSIDGRTNVNPLRIAEDQGAAYGGRIGWEDYFRQVSPESVIWKNPSPLSALLVQSTEWCRVYCDGSSELGYSVFVRRSFFESKDANFWGKDYCADTSTTCARNTEARS